MGSRSAQWRTFTITAAGIRSAQHFGSLARLVRWFEIPLGWPGVRTSHGDVTMPTGLWLRAVLRGADALQRVRSAVQ